MTRSGVLPPPSWATSLGVRGEIRTRNNAVLDRTRLPVAPPERWWAVVEDLNLGDPDGIPGLQPGAFSLSANCPNTNCQRSGGRQATRTPMSRGTWLSRPVGYQLPEPSGYNLKLDLKGNYRLDERHQDCPTVSRYDRRPRLNKRRIQQQTTAGIEISQ